MSSRPTPRRRPPLHLREPAVDPPRPRRKPRADPAPKRLSEPALLLELTSALDSGPDTGEALAAALSRVMGELQVERWALFVRAEDGGMTLRVSRRLPPGAPLALGSAVPGAGAAALEPGDDPHDRHGLVRLVPIRRQDRTIAVLGVGPRGGGYGAEEQVFLDSVAACLATCVENALIRDELRRVHQKLSVKYFELHNLFDLSRDLAEGVAEDAIQRRVTTTLMGHFVVARGALYLCGPQGLSLAHGRGLRRETESEIVPIEDARKALEGLARPSAVDELADGPLRRLLLEARMALAVPLLATGGRVEGVLAIGARASGLPFSEEDREVAEALARQAQAALENARLQRVREEKLRQDRELQIAREIQRGLFPSDPPEVPGFDVAGESRPCYEVGGDAYDWIPLVGGRLAVMIADVAGKGTPASLLMASVHAFVHALAGTVAPAEMLERLNRFLYARTQASKFVTLFYTELDPAERRLVYVNAGHIPPFRIARDGTLGRLTQGGPALGLLDEATYEVGELRLEPGELVAMVTDGVTEANSPDDREFGDERVAEALSRLSSGGASAVLHGLVAAVNDWAGGQGFGDDLTTVVLKMR